MLKNDQTSQMVVEHTRDSTSLCVQGQPGLQREFQDSQGYTEKPCLKKPKKKKKRKKEKKKKKFLETQQYYRENNSVSDRTLNRT